MYARVNHTCFSDVPYRSLIMAEKWLDGWLDAEPAWEGQYSKADIQAANRDCREFKKLKREFREGIMEVIRDHMVKAVVG